MLELRFVTSSSRIRTCCGSSDCKYASASPASSASSSPSTISCSPSFSPDSCPVSSASSVSSPFSSSASSVSDGSVVSSPSVSSVPGISTVSCAAHASPVSPMISLPNIATINNILITLEKRHFLFFSICLLLFLMCSSFYSIRRMVRISPG